MWNWMMAHPYLGSSLAWWALCFGLLLVAELVQNVTKVLVAWSPYAPAAAEEATAEDKNEHFWSAAERTCLEVSEEYETCTDDHSKQIAFGARVCAGRMKQKGQED